MLGARAVATCIPSSDWSLETLSARPCVAHRSTLATRSRRACTGLHSRLTLRELSQTQNMRRRVFLEATKSARDLLNENPTIMDMLEDVKREQVRAGVICDGVRW